MLEMTDARQGRAAQILAAAAELLLRHGYARITMEDVAQHAGVGTGTLYLHWRTKEALFETVLLGELLAIWHALDQHLAADSSEALLSRLLGRILHLVNERPLAKALFTRDSSLLGKLAQRRLLQNTQTLARATDLLRQLRALGLVRTDVAVTVQAHAFSAVWAGFSLIDPLLTGDDRVALDVQIDALAYVVRQTFEPTILPDATTLHTLVVPTLRSLLDEAQAAVKQHIRERMLPQR
ncbi:helix-turn-helix transcriptional regulator [Candidatus Gracilibacteria bacterium]|nr:helix-turn-helix transcriptional regulator [Candidatus Gracilibacteria bacterium]